MTAFDHKSPAIIASEIAMTRNVLPAGVLLVEGDTDIRFWRSRVESHRSELVDAEGKDNLLGAIMLLDRDAIPGVLGVVDDDRDSLVGRSHVSPNVVATDTADLECLLLRSPAWHRLLAEFADPQKVAAFTREHGDARDGLLERGLVFGRLRWLLHRQQWVAPRGTFKPYQFIDKATWSVQQDALYHRVANAIDQSVPTLRAGVAALPAVDPWRVCRGHDLIALLIIGLQGVLGPAPGKKKLPLEGLMQVLRSGFDDASLHATQMWAEMCAWEAHNPDHRMLRR